MALDRFGMDDLAMNMQVAWLTRSQQSHQLPWRFLYDSFFDRETIGVAAGRFTTGSAEMDSS